MEFLSYEGEASAGGVEVLQAAGQAPMGAGSQATFGRPDYPIEGEGHAKLARNVSARSSSQDNTGQVNHVNKPAREQGRGLEGARTDQGKVDEAGGPQR